MKAACVCGGLGNLIWRMICRSGSSIDAVPGGQRNAFHHWQRGGTSLLLGGPADREAMMSMGGCVHAGIADGSAGVCGRRISPSPVLPSARDLTCRPSGTSSRSCGPRTAASSSSTAHASPPRRGRAGTGPRANGSGSRRRLERPLRRCGVLQQGDGARPARCGAAEADDLRSVMQDAMKDQRSGADQLLIVRLLVAARPFVGLLRPFPLHPHPFPLGDARSSWSARHDVALLARYSGRTQHRCRRAGETAMARSHLGITVIRAARA